MNNHQGRQPGDPSRRPFGLGERPSGCWISLLWLVLLVLIVPWLWTMLAGGEPETQISYTNFRQQVEEGNIQAITVSGERITGKLEAPIQEENEAGETFEFTSFATYLPSFGDEELFSLLEAQGVDVQTGPAESFSWFAILLNAVPFLLMIGLAFFFLRGMRSQGSGVMSMGKSRAKRYERSAERTTFKDVAGNRGAKREIEEIIDFLKEPKRFESLGGEIPKGALLVGPPGTGKTLLARAVAGEASVPFFNISGSDFMEMFVGVGASRVRDLFKEAKASSPSIIFIDELDSIGRRRGAGLGGGHDEREQTLNQLLSEMDGFEPKENVIVMAATNRPDVLDPALLRPGRFDRQITVDLPTMQDREEILKIHAENKPMATDVDLSMVARATPGFSGADLANILNEAALLAARRRQDEIHARDINDARDKVLMGLERENLCITDEERQLLAYHEAGHALVAAVLPNADPLHKVTIIPRGRAMGVTQQIAERDRYIYPREYLLDRMAVMMGGRAAEELVLNTSTSGAENDLKQATKMARKMVLDWGMSKRLGHIALSDERDEVFLGEEITQRREYSDNTAREVDQEVKGILEEAFNRATKTLQEHRQGLDRVVVKLLEAEEIAGQEVMELLGLPLKRLEGKPLP